MARLSIPGISAWAMTTKIIAIPFAMDMALLRCMFLNFQGTKIMQAERKGERIHSFSLCRGAAYFIERYYVCFKKEKGVDLNIKKIYSNNHCITSKIHTQ